MKKITIVAASVVAGAMLFSACGTAMSSSTSMAVPSAPMSESSSMAAPSASMPATSTDESAVMEDMIYRGAITNVLEDGSIEVTQLPGFNYGHEKIVFHMDDSTMMSEEGMTLALDGFVEVMYSGALTFSIPPQGTAKSITLISTMSEGIIVNGSILSTETTSDGYSITVLPMDADPAAGEEFHVVLNVPMDALEGITEADLVEGAQVSAVTNGIATASIPPQMPVHALMMYDASLPEAAASTSAASSMASSAATGVI